MASTITTSIVTGGSNNHSTVASEANAYATDFVSQGVLGSITNTNGSAPTTGSFGVNQNTGSDLNLKVLGSGNTGSGAAVAYVTTTPASQDKQVLRARMTADYAGYAINANSTGSTVYDWIYLQANATNANVPSAGADNVVTLVTSRSTSNTTDNGTPPTYGINIAIVTVANGATAITNANIQDMRTQAGISATATGNSTGWTTLGYPLTYSSNGGGKNYVATASADLTGILSEGMKLRITRAVTPPTQCMAFASGSSQYATKASPTGITFTGAFSCEAWIYLQSYTGSPQQIISREPSAVNAGGWSFYIDASGRPSIEYGTTTTYTTISSYNAIPLNTWVHVAGVVTSVASKTGNIYINGTSVTTQNVNNSGTTLTQATVDLRLGSISDAAARLFNGYMSEVRLWSINQTAANIQANMTKSLVGNEANLIALFQGNGNFTDATSNANTLTASGGAIATQSNNPYNLSEYAVVTSVSYSNPTTTINLFTGDAGNLPNMTLSNPVYSIQENPFGLPGGLGKNRVIGLRLLMAGTNNAANTIFDIPGLSCPVTVPAGRRVRIIGYVADVQNASGTSNATELNIYEGSTQFTKTRANTPTGENRFIGSPITYQNPTSGSHTYKLSTKNDVAANVLLDAGTTFPAFLEVRLD